MILILVRHAPAIEREDFKSNNQEDGLRPITIKGKRRMQKVGFKLREWVDEVDLIVTSPLLRATQSAEILSQIFDEAPVKQSPELVPECPPKAFIKWVKFHGKNIKTMLVVGHEPHLSLLSSYILTGHEEAQILMKKSAMICFKIDTHQDIIPGKAKLLWHVQPKMVGR